jgi:hypothetical protein
LFFAPKQAFIDEAITCLRSSSMDLNIEDNVAGFLGFLIEHNNSGKILLMQIWLINRIIVAMHLTDAKPKLTPAEYGALPVDKHGEPCLETFNYTSVVGMLMYLSANTWLDIAFAVHQCSQYMHTSESLVSQDLMLEIKFFVGANQEMLMTEVELLDGTVNCFWR